MGIISECKDQLGYRVLAVPFPEIERKKLYCYKKKNQNDQYGAALEETHVYIISAKEQWRIETAADFQE